MYNHKCHICNNNSKGSRVARVRGFISLWGVLIMVAAASALPAAAAPFAYVANGNGVSVIDIASNMVVATVPVGGIAVAVTPDGKHAYVANVTNNILRGNGVVSVIDTATNTVVATMTVVGPAGGG